MKLNHSLKSLIIGFTVLLVATGALAGEPPSFKLRPESKKIRPEICDPVEQVGILSIAAIGTAYVSFESLPEELTNWPKKLKDSSLFDNYAKHTKKVVYDSDEWAINYIGHPVSGMAYYNMSRMCGRSPLQSFLFSALMSTMWWEYGIEAFFEEPSIQDLFSTPIIGSLMGELAYRAIERLEENDDRLLGSKRLGRFTKNALDPFSYLLRSIRNSGILLSVGPLARPQDKSYGVSVNAYYPFSSQPKYLRHRCSLNEVGELSQAALPATSNAIAADYERLMKKGKYCQAAQLAARVELEKPQWIEKLNARGKILKALADGRYLIDQLIEMEHQKPFLAVPERQTEALVGLAQTYVHYLPSRECTEPDGILDFGDNHRRTYRQEALAITMLAGSRLKAGDNRLDQESRVLQESLGSCRRK